MKPKLNFWPTFNKTQQLTFWITSRNGRRKRIIKAEIPPDFLLKWFLKSLQPEISKDVSIFGVYSEEQAIFRAQQLELIYSQSGTLQKILPDAPRSTVDIGKPKPSPHANGIFGSIDANAVNLLSQL